MEKTAEITEILRELRQRLSSLYGENRAGVPACIFITRKNPNLETKANHTYNGNDDYNGSVRVVDVFCNDTAKSLEVRT